MAGSVSGVWHFRMKIDPDGPAEHPNIEPQCHQESMRLLKQEALGYMTEKREEVSCLACLLLMERGA